jgi:hypothetical protein
MICSEKSIPFPSMDAEEPKPLAKVPLKQRRSISIPLPGWRPPIPKV